MKNRSLVRVCFTVLLVALLAACTGEIRTVPVTGAAPDASPHAAPDNVAPEIEPTAQVQPSDTATHRVFAPIITRSPSSTQPPTVPPPDGGPAPTGGQGWYMAGANPERTSWTAEAVTGNLHVEWYRPIEAYIPQNAQLIASDGMIFVATSRGLYALNADNGSAVWRYDTQMPLGNSPTVVNSVVYVGGYDRKLVALQASTGQVLWSFNDARAGYSTNPIVVDGKVIAANRDGNIYAVGAANTPTQGQLLWKFQSGGPIDLSPAYKDGAVYFAALDNYAYAIRLSDGALIWRSQKLPGDGYQSYWPVIYQDKVIFSGASGYRTGMTPGTNSILDANGDPYGKIYDIERDDLFNGVPLGGMIGSPVANQAWSNGKPVLDASRITNYLETKPWHRVYVVLNRNDGSEYTFDSDHDGKPEYMPVTMWGTHSGNRYPPLVGSDDTLYQSVIMQNQSIPQGRVMGWKFGTALLSQVGGQGAVDEPQAISAGGNIIYRSICCDRVGDWFSITENRTGQMWSYTTTLSQQIPNYDAMWYGSDPNDTARLRGNYGTQNGIYNNHGDQNPIIPYEGRLYIHRSNTIIAYGPGAGPVAMPLLTINNVNDNLQTPSQDELRARLESEVQKIVSAGHLRPGYYNQGQFNYTQLANYFENPGDTLYTLTIAYPYLSSGLQAQVQAYLQTEYQNYFVTNMIARLGWADGASREAMPIPPDVANVLPSLGNTLASDPRFSWAYSPFNFYALWKYSALFPDKASQAYSLAKGKIQVPVPQLASNDYLLERPYEINAYIAGYIGFLRLQELAGRTSQDAMLRTQVTNELNRLQNLRSSSFSKDTPYVNGYGSYHLRTLNISRNFLFMVPELGDYLNQTALNRVQQAVDEYNFTAPYWFVARYNAAVNEGGRQNLYDVPAMFQAKAYILKESRSQLAEYLDVPAFERGDLFYLQNLVALIEAR